MRKAAQGEILNAIVESLPANFHLDKSGTDWLFTTSEHYFVIHNAPDISTVLAKVAKRLSEYP